MRFEFATAGRIVFGRGAAAELPKVAASLGGRAMLVTGRDPERHAGLLNGVACATFPVSGEPTVDLIRQGAAQARAARCNLIIAIGGGSAIDAGKAIAAIAANAGDILDYLEVVGRGAPLERPPLPFVAVPTTAGTGSEVTRNAVLAAPEHGVKASLRSPMMLARVAIVDPELTIGLPPDITAHTGLDALTQLIEPFVSVRANPLTDGFCCEGLHRIASGLLRAYRNG